MFPASDVSLPEGTDCDMVLKKPKVETWKAYSTVYNFRVILKILGDSDFPKRGCFLPSRWQKHKSDPNEAAKTRLGWKEGRIKW